LRRVVGVLAIAAFSWRAGGAGDRRINKGDEGGDRGGIGGAIEVIRVALGGFGGNFGGPLQRGISRGSMRNPSGVLATAEIVNRGACSGDGSNES
jgi:hypothetical protein